MAHLPRGRTTRGLRRTARRLPAAHLLQVVDGAHGLNAESPHGGGGCGRHGVCTESATSGGRGLTGTEERRGGSQQRTFPILDSDVLLDSEIRAAPRLRRRTRARQLQRGGDCAQPGTGQAAATASRRSRSARYKCKISKQPHDISHAPPAPRPQSPQQPRWRMCLDLRTPSCPAPRPHRAAAGLTRGCDAGAE